MTKRNVLKRLLKKKDSKRERKIVREREREKDSKREREKDSKRERER
jgi:hypothetical protein